MKRVILVVCVLCILFAVPITSQNTPPPLVGLGDSLGEGVQSADASNRTQPFGYLNLVGQQMAVSFPLPLIQSSPLGVVGETKNRSRVQPGLLASNLAVSGATVDSLLNDQAGQPIDDETDLVLSPRTGSQMQIAESLRAPFTICWIGNNDVLSAVLAFNHLDTSQMTSVAAFSADYAQIVSRLSAAGGHVLAANIPDVTHIAFVVSPQDLVTFLGSDLGLPQGSYTTVPTMLLIKLGLADSSILQNPDYVLDAQEIQAIQQRTQQFNQIIATDAAQAGMAVADIAALFNAVAAHPPVIDGVTLTTRFLGGLFSLDGVHPSNIGHAVVANTFIDTANAAFGMSIPRISRAVLLKTAVGDPFIDWNGNLIVRGRPLAGLLETLGPFLGISGDLQDFPGGLPGPTARKIDRNLGVRFMQQYFALKGLPPSTRWTLNDAIAAMQEVFRF